MLYVAALSLSSKSLLTCRSGSLHLASWASVITWQRAYTCLTKVSYYTRMSLDVGIFCLAMTLLFRNQTLCLSSSHHNLLRATGLPCLTLLRFSQSAPCFLSLKSPLMPITLLRLHMQRRYGQSLLSVTIVYWHFCQTMHKMIDLLESSYGGSAPDPSLQVHDVLHSKVCNWFPCMACDLSASPSCSFQTRSSLMTTQSCLFVKHQSYAISLKPSFKMSNFNWSKPSERSMLWRQNAMPLRITFVKLSPWWRNLGMVYPYLLEKSLKWL